MEEAGPDMQTGSVAGVFQPHVGVVLGESPGVGRFRMNRLGWEMSERKMARGSLIGCQGIFGG